MKREPYNNGDDYEVIAIRHIEDGCKFVSNINTLIMKIIMCLFSPFLVVSGAFSQKGWDWMPLWERSVLDSVMNIYYTHNKMMVFDTVYYDIEQKIVETINLTSKDGTFITIFDLSQPFTREDSIRGDRVTSTYDWDRANREHIWKVKELLYYEDKDIKDRWKDYVCYLSTSEAKNKFHADTAIYFPLQRSPFMGNKFEKCEVLIIHKKDRGCLSMFFHYNADSKENIKELITAMESSIKYGDEVPSKKKIPLPHGIMEIIPFPTQQKQSVIR